MFSSLFPQEGAEFVQLKKPASILEAVNVMDEHIWRRGPSRDGYCKQNYFQGHTSPPQGSKYNGRPHRQTKMTQHLAAGGLSLSINTNRQTIQWRVWQ